MPPTQPPSITQELKNFYNSIPVVTRALLVATTACSITGSLGLIPFHSLLLVWPAVTRHFQLWRLVTTFFTGHFKIHFAFNLYLLYVYANKLETEIFLNNPADLAFFFLFNGGVQLLLDRFWSNTYALQQCIMPACMYLWCRKNPQQEVTFMYGFRFKAMYLPFVIVAYEFMTSPPGPGPLPTIFGIISAHAYHYLKWEHPQQRGGRSFLETPSFLQRLLPPSRATASWQRPGVGHVWNSQGQRQQGPSTSTASSTSNLFGGRWGRGRRLGS
ncbi:DER1-domain-containing protein [Hesseltinella vesiculosa]|uniref:Derlin n=1 Tax=Hesseltinella vesiculosa TaxID=101127 RepID=A0A1X2GQ71_9FUNG|nr:DER1-domain-containing protein [Hesseltinella vesiculosa]